MTSRSTGVSKPETVLSRRLLQACRCQEGKPMFNIHGISQDTKVAYYGYRKARAQQQFFSCSIEDVDGLRQALHDLSNKQDGTNHSPQNHETFVLIPDIKGGPPPVLAITFSDCLVHFGGTVLVQDWDDPGTHSKRSISWRNVKPKQSHS